MAREPLDESATTQPHRQEESPVAEALFERTASFLAEGTGSPAEVSDLMESVQAEYARLSDGVGRGATSVESMAGAKADLYVVCLWLAAAASRNASRSKVLHFVRDNLGVSLLPDPTYRYTNDWFSQHIPAWTTDLAPFEGRASLQFLEIGCFEGRCSTWLLANVLTHETSRLTCVDTFDMHARQQEYFDHNVAAVGGTARVKQVRGDSEQVLRALPWERFDFIYVDADHRALPALRDAAAAWPLLKVGGTMTFDDYEWDRRYFPERYRDHPRIALLTTRRGIDAFLLLYEGHYEVIRKEYQVTVRKTLATPR